MCEKEVKTELEIQPEDVVLHPDSETFVVSSDVMADLFRWAFELDPDDVATSA